MEHPPAERALHRQGGDGEAGEAKLNEEKDVQKEFRALEGQSSLNAARDAYFGEETEVVSWTETEATDEEYEAMRDMVQQGDEQMEEFAESIDGVRYDFTFKPGEYKKVITVETWTMRSANPRNR